ncbi:type II secretion system protein N [Microbulbifer aggregans]|uniref:type II secretion system protein N n=1 Tax=Microbulbifer aggregans TaxID=1769779 RepID=UPI001CFE79C7|nr:type II secretion system protein N [Microbulbifer aggregans]
MSLVKRAVASVVNKSAGSSPNTFRRSLWATAGVVGGWLSVNLVAYGSLVLPGSGEESLLVERGARPAASAPAVNLPNTPFFGVAEIKKETAVAELDLENIPITQLNLVLSGVLSSSVDDRASALIAERGKPAQRVFVGETMAGGAEVYSVEVDHIILRRNGQMEKLTYPDADGRPTVPKQYANYAREAAKAIGANASMGSADKQQSIRDRLEQLREMARSRQNVRSQK